MSEDEPQIIELDPEGAPRMTAFILLACGLLGVAFLLVNVVFTGEDQYYIESDWEDGTEPVNQRYDILPNLVRGRNVGDRSEEDEEATDVPVRRPTRRSTTGPLSPLNPYLARPTTPSLPTVPGTPATPGTPRSPGDTTTNPPTPK
jgi:hypothetical protein